MRNLNRLELKSNKITKIENLNNLENLKLLTLSCNLINTISEEDLPVINNLEELGLFGNFLGVDYVQFNNNINFDISTEEDFYLKIDNQNLTFLENILELLNTKFKNLKKLYLGGNNFSKLRNFRKIVRDKLDNIKFLDGQNI